MTETKQQERQASLDEIGLVYATPGFGKGKAYTGGDKTTLDKGFTLTYDRLLAPLRNEAVNVLELGVHSGKSLAMWSDFFCNGQVYGIDYDRSLFDEAEGALARQGAFSNKNVHVYEQDVTKMDHKWLSETIPARSFHLIIDDAKHESATQKANFDVLFPLLAEGGFYIIEDITDPIGVLTLFRDTLGSVAGGTTNKLVKHTATSSQIGSVTIQPNLLIFHKRTRSPSTKKGSGGATLRVRSL